MSFATVEDSSNEMASVDTAMDHPQRSPVQYHIASFNHVTTLKNLVDFVRSRLGHDGPLQDQLQVLTDATNKHASEYCYLWHELKNCKERLLDVNCDNVKRVNEILKMEKIARREKELAKEVFREFAVLQITIRECLGLAGLHLLRHRAGHKVGGMSNWDPISIDTMFETHLEAMRTGKETDVLIPLKRRLDIFLREIFRTDTKIQGRSLNADLSMIIRRDETGPGSSDNQNAHSMHHSSSMMQLREGLQDLALVPFPHDGHVSLDNEQSSINTSERTDGEGSMALDGVEEHNGISSEGNSTTEIASRQTIPTMDSGCEADNEDHNPSLDADINNSSVTTSMEGLDTQDQGDFVPTGPPASHPEASTPRPHRNIPDDSNSSSSTPSSPLSSFVSIGHDGEEIGEERSPEVFYVWPRSRRPSRVMNP